MLDAIRGWVLAVCSTRNRGIVSVVDSGYDVSTHGSVSDVPLQAEDFVTLGDLLDAPNGGTDATYVSGSGLRATTFEDDLMHRLFDVKAEWISAHYPDMINDATDSLTDAICDLLVDPMQLVYAEDFRAINLDDLLAGRLKEFPS
jgi:hypothetical protein